MSNSSIFGWSYPPGCSGPPDDYYSDPIQPKCYHCGAFLPSEPDMRMRHDFLSTNYGSTVPPLAVNVRQIDCPLDFAPEEWYEYEVPDSDLCYVTRCRKCGKLNETYDY